MKRTDVHRPSAINPMDYKFIAFEQVKIMSFGDCDYILEQRARIQAHMKETGGTYSHHAHGGNCMICGNANATYTALFYHAATNSYVRAGQDCTDKLEMSGLDWNEFRKSVGDAMQARAGKKKAQALLEAAGLSEAWAVSLTERPACDCPNADHGWHASKCEKDYKPEATIKDILVNVVKYGNLSDNKANYLRVLLDQIKNRPAIAAARALEAANAAPCPVGRIVITGTVLTVKEVVSTFQSGNRRFFSGRHSEPDTTFKILVRDDSGFKVWGTRPAGTNAERGSRLKFTATVEPSKDDAKFGFYKRPAKAELLTA